MVGDGQGTDRPAPIETTRGAVVGEHMVLSLVGRGATHCRADSHRHGHPPGATRSPLERPTSYRSAMTTTITLYRRFITDDRGRRHQTRYLMSEADALATDPTAEPVPGSIEIRQRPACLITCGAGCIFQLLLPTVTPRMRADFDRAALRNLRAGISTKR